METDSLFYELFKADPRSLFQLVRLDIEGDYAFESITVKRTEKRPDGFFRRTDGKEGPNIFLELQGWNDPMIYWRSFREVCTWHEQSCSTDPFIIIILFVDKKYDPGNRPLTCLPPHKFIRTTLPACLRKLKEEKAGVLTVLKPFGLSGKKKLTEAVREWEADIGSLELPEHKIKELRELLLYAVLQRFSELTRKEIEEMLELTPLDKTVAGQELIQIGIEKGEKKGERKGRKKGILIGEIRLAQRILKDSVTPEGELARKSIKKLKEIFQQLESELGAH
ncbi:DUF2887 domain-containing protein [Desulfococcaceae bacterium HSG8]|nr:DUF2887 domain-containing protein [Desulfococcaceae bacterium HSG8]